MRNPDVIIMGIVVILGVGGAIYVYYSHDTTQASHRIELTETGFVPQTITILQGDTIIFTTTQNKPFWPASDLHPTHEMYPEFDPKSPVNPGKKWSFQFNRVGIWKYHDHLNPLYGGTITVLDGEGAQISYGCGEEEESDASRRRQCWEKRITTALQDKGVEAALEVVGDLYGREPEFAANCHGYVHVIGKEAYRLFAAEKDIILTSKTHYCGFGFYHAFMETLMQTTGDIRQAQEFCAYVDKQLAVQTPGSWKACYHGIGHGAVDGEDPRTWGDAQAMIQPALDLCESISQQEIHKDLCGSGVFNSLAIMYGNPQYRLSIEKDDPYWICREQSRPYFKKPCYEEMNTLVLRFGSYDFSQAVQYVEKIPEDAYALFAIQSLAGYAASFHPNKTRYDLVIQVCDNLSSYLRASCIRGFVGGLLEFGPPETQYLSALEFCASPMLDDPGRAVCYQALVEYSWHLYPKEKHQEVCGIVAQRYQPVCS